jgi:hypothetical protein
MIKRMFGDFLPGYVLTITSKDFKKLEDNIIIIGQEDGKIYNTFKNKNDLFLKVLNRKNNMHVLCFYQNDINFTKQEMEQLWNKNIWPLSKREADKIKIPYLV